MNKSFRFVVALVIVSMILVSCASATPEPPTGSNATTAPEVKDPEEKAEKIQLTMEASSYVEAAHKAAYDKIKEMYEAANPNVELVYNGIPYADYWDKLTTEIVAGNESCIIEMQSGAQHYGTYAALREGETGSFVNLDPYLAKTDLANKLVDQGSMVYNGHNIGLSDYAWGARAIYYRKSLFKEAGIDPATLKTQDDFLAAAIKLTKPAADGKPAQYGFGAVLSTHPFVWDEFKTFIARPIGATYTKDNLAPFTADNVLVDSPAMKWAFKWWQDMIFVSKVTPQGSYDKASDGNCFGMER